MKKLFVAAGFGLTMFFGYASHSGWDVIESIYNIGSDTGHGGPGSSGRSGSSGLHHK